MPSKQIAQWDRVRCEDCGKTITPWRHHPEQPPGTYLCHACGVTRQSAHEPLLVPIIEELRRRLAYIQSVADSREARIKELEQEKDAAWSHVTRGARAEAELADARELAADLQLQLRSGSSGDELVNERMAAERAEWRAKLAAAEEKSLRSMSEFESYKRRSQRETDHHAHDIIGRLLEDFLPLGDNLSRAKEAAKGDLQILEGLTIVEQSFYGALSKHDIAPVLALGCSFDTKIHEAIARQITDQESGLVVEELEKGYTWRGRLVRPAKVVVSMKRKEE